MTFLSNIKHPCCVYNSLNIWSTCVLLKGSTMQCLSWYWIWTRMYYVLGVYRISESQVFMCTDLQMYILGTQSQNGTGIEFAAHCTVQVYTRKDHLRCAPQACVNWLLYYMHASTVTAVVKTVYTKSTQTAVHSWHWTPARCILLVFEVLLVIKISCFYILDSHLSLDSSTKYSLLCHLQM